jgi:hypothetical protein
MRLWKHWNEILLRFFCSLLRPLPPWLPASERAPGQPVEVLRARERLFSTAIAGPIPGQLLFLNSVP